MSNKDLCANNLMYPIHTWSVLTKRVKIIKMCTLCSVETQCRFTVNSEQWTVAIHSLHPNSVTSADTIIIIKRELCKYIHIWDGKRKGINIKLYIFLTFYFAMKLILYSIRIQSQNVYVSDVFMYYICILYRVRYTHTNVNTYGFLYDDWLSVCVCACVWLCVLCVFILCMY